MSTTLLPFLYQTRTLQRLSRARVATPVFRSRSLIHALARVNLPKHRLTRPPSKDAIPFEIPADVDVIDEPEDLEPGQRSTITPTERDAFNRIFEEIATRGIRSANKKPASDSQKPLAGSKSPLAASIAGQAEMGSQHARESINAILQDAKAEITEERSSSRSPFPLLHPLGQMDTSRDPGRALLRFPPSLRRAARMAMGVMDQENLDRGWSKADSARAIDVWEGEDNEPEPDARQLLLDGLAEDPIAEAIDSEASRRIERLRVEGLMREAKTDFELWDIMEAEVFPLVDKLGISNQEAPQPKKRLTKKRAAAARAAKAASKEADEARVSMHLYGPLYPSYLLSALRLMDTQFARSSPLALNILPRIKELGLTSYVLGVSTPFYNTLANIHWRRYGNPEAVFNLFEEMRHAGLYCNEDSFGIVMSIERRLEKFRDGSSGPFLKEVVTLPEYEYAIRPRITHWLKTIDVQIHESKNEFRP
ncbi:hypothetical protein B0T19DRAFT_269578 [Cercophora scortea]|uniref:Mtf2-like C-terminal domain-containing protein n=1 Tax=Cercophora scortea TaxID=314031 RepID=A0AAE0I764_9PEZI|nr:hypothetical protein B0T19DRAFT_269578 [Cercophora scortea]